MRLCLKKKIFNKNRRVHPREAILRKNRDKIIEKRIYGILILSVVGLCLI